MSRKIIRKIPFARFLFRLITNYEGKQTEETQAIKKYIPINPSPYFVDIGAHDGISISNSKYFAKIGWKGMLFEPMPKVFSRLYKRYKNNNNIKCLNIACSNKQGVLDFHIGSDGEEGMLGTLCADNNDWFKSKRSEKTIKVDVDTITNQLVKNNFPKDFTLLLIDTEGMDYEVLLGMDFKLFQPHIIVTEEYKWNLAKHNNKYRLLKEKGYELKELVECNTIWVRKSN